MMTLLVNVHDDAKVKDVVSFLRDIEFLEVFIKDDISKQNKRRHPDKKLLKTKIVGDIMESVVPDSEWEALREVNP